MGYYQSMSNLRGKHFQGCSIAKMGFAPCRLGEDNACHNCGNFWLMRSIEQQPQAQVSTAEQLKLLALWANRLGLYDAADVVNVLANEAIQKSPQDCNERKSTCTP
jgi:hypothetical protein